MSEFQPLRYNDGYLPLEDYGLIGDGSTAALVGRDGTLGWLCVPRFDSPPLFCPLLDARRGGVCRIAPEETIEARQYYLEDTAVLVTELRTTTGVVAITDFLALRKGADLSEDAAAGRSELFRCARVLEGRVRLWVEVSPHEGAEPERHAGGLRLHCRARPDLDLHLEGDLAPPSLSGVFELTQGAQRFLQLRWGGGARRRETDPRAYLDGTIAAWREWMRRFAYSGPSAAHVRRSALTLKLLDYSKNGAIVAAPTSSLPERIGGVRNWDYRYSWIRDAAFSVYALRNIGFPREAYSFLGWTLGVAETAGRPCVLYDLDGRPPATERVDEALEGYRGSCPVRWGNAAAGQRQHDVFGEILDCAWQWISAGHAMDAHLLARLDELAEAAAREWSEPDHGIWEVRAPGRPFTYSAALCHVALDRGMRIHDRLGAGERGRWRSEAENIRRAILERAWNDERGFLCEHLDGGGLDASLLALPLRRVLPFDHPRTVATVEAIAKGLGAGDGLLYRYLPEESPDGLPGHEGAFLLCSFWLVDNLIGQGKLDEAQALFASLCARTNALGLLPEQIDPASGAFLGNYPQAFSHVGLISSAVNLSRALGLSGRSS